MLRIADQSLAPRLLVLDKDGTLITFDKLWHAWFDHFMQALLARTALGEPARLDLAHTLGYDPDTGVWDPLGPLTLAPTWEVLVLVAGVLYHHQGWGWDESLALVEKAEEDTLAGLVLDDLIEPVGDIRGTLQRLQKAGIVLAVVTTDKRASTEHTLARLGLQPLFAAVLCGDDGLPNKPAPDTALEVCRRVNIPPEQAAMIGDTIADMNMARRAGYGWAIGVASGALSAEALAPHADLVIPDVNAIEVITLDKGGGR